VLENPSAPVSVATLNKAAVAAADPQIISASRWFWWIAGLSLVNTVLIHSGSDTSFLVGLGFTLMADAMFQGIPAVAFVIDALAIGSFVAFGWFAGKGHVWAFITGIVLYSIDALIYLPLQAWMSVGFHVFALFFIVRGMQQLRTRLKEAAASAAAEPPVLAEPPRV
jgi:hypothetical protein